MSRGLPKQGKQETLCQLHRPLRLSTQTSSKTPTQLRIDEAKVVPDLESPHDYATWHCHSNLVERLEYFERRDYCFHDKCVTGEKLLLYVSLTQEIRKKVADHVIKYIGSRGVGSLENMHHAVREACRRMIQEENVGKADECEEPKDGGMCELPNLADEAEKRREAGPCIIL